MNEKISVVIPCYCSGNTLYTVLDETRKEFKKLGVNNYNFILVNDCSPDSGKTLAVISDLVQQYNDVLGINLAKNSGQHNAVMCGLNFSDGDIIMTLDDDMQTHPSQIGPILNKLNDGYDVVYGYYLDKKENLFRRIGSSFSDWTVTFFLGKPKNLKTSSFWMIRKFVRDYAIQYRSPNVRLLGIFMRITRNAACVPIKHFERVSGTSGYTLKKLFNLYKSILSYSKVPTKVVFDAGIWITILSLLAIIISLIVLLVSHTSIILSLILESIFLSCGLILMSIGTVGFNVERIFDTVTNDPQFVIKDILKKQ